MIRPWRRCQKYRAFPAGLIKCGKMTAESDAARSSLPVPGRDPPLKVNQEKIFWRATARLELRPLRISSKFGAGANAFHPCWRPQPGDWRMGQGPRSEEPPP
jgi:hypothetical protein